MNEDHEVDVLATWGHVCLAEGSDYSKVGLGCSVEYCTILICVDQGEIKVIENEGDVDEDNLHRFRQFHYALAMSSLSPHAYMLFFVDSSVHVCIDCLTSHLVRHSGSQVDFYDLQNLMLGFMLWSLRWSLQSLPSSSLAHEEVE